MDFENTDNIQVEEAENTVNLAEIGGEETSAQSGTVASVNSAEIEQSTDKPLDTDLAENADTSTAENADAKQSTQDNARFAEQRRKQEYEDRFFKENLSWLNNPDTGKPFESTDEWKSFMHTAEERRQAESAGLTPEQYRDFTEKMRKQIIETDPEIAAARETAAALQARENERVYTETLQAIKKAYPDEKAKHISELGKPFLKMCAAGVEPVIAYSALRSQSGNDTKQPSMGDINKNTGGTEKDFISRDEAMHMSSEERIKNYDIIRKSQAKW